MNIDTGSTGLPNEGYYESWIDNNGVRRTFDYQRYRREREYAKERWEQSQASFADIKRSQGEDPDIAVVFHMEKLTEVITNANKDCNELIRKRKDLVGDTNFLIPIEINIHSGLTKLLESVVDMQVKINDIRQKCLEEISVHGSHHKGEDGYKKDSPSLKYKTYENP